MLDERRATAVARALGLEERALQLCALCLFGVSAALRSGDPLELRSALRFFVPLLWGEGLEQPLRDALQRAVVAGVPDAAEAAADVDRYGPACRVTKAVVRLLAEQQLRELRVLERRLRAPPPSVAADN